jgi:hypothetical protein
LQEKGFAPRRVPGGLKILVFGGELTKKVTIEAAHFFSGAAELKSSKQNGISFPSKFPLVK